MTLTFKKGVKEEATRKMDRRIVKCMTEKENEMTTQLINQDIKLKMRPIVLLEKYIPIKYDTDEVVSSSANYQPDMFDSFTFKSDLSDSIKIEPLSMETAVLGLTNKDETNHETVDSKRTTDNFFVTEKENETRGGSKKIKTEVFDEKAQYRLKVTIISFKKRSNRNSYKTRGKGQNKAQTKNKKINKNRQIVMPTEEGADMKDKRDDVFLTNNAMENSIYSGMSNELDNIASDTDNKPLHETHIPRYTSYTPIIDHNYSKSDCMYSRSTTGSYRCLICKYENHTSYRSRYIKNKASLIYHFKKRHSDVVMLYCCYGCGRKFSSIALLSDHTVTQTKYFERKYLKCHFCMRECKSKCSLEQHVLKEHADKLLSMFHLHSCRICGKKCSSVYTLMNHKRTIHGIPMQTNESKVKDYMCLNCGKAFRTKSSPEYGKCFRTWCSLECRHYRPSWVDLEGGQGVPGPLAMAEDEILTK